MSISPWLIMSPHPLKPYGKRFSHGRAAGPDLLGTVFVVLAHGSTCFNCVWHIWSSSSWIGRLDFSICRTQSPFGQLSLPLLVQNGSHFQILSLRDFQNWLSHLAIGPKWFSGFLDNFPIGSNDFFEILVLHRPGLSH